MKPMGWRCLASHTKHNCPSASPGFSGTSHHSQCPEPAPQQYERLDRRRAPGSAGRARARLGQAGVLQGSRGTPSKQSSSCTQHLLRTWHPPRSLPVSLQQMLTGDLLGHRPQRFTEKHYGLMRGFQTSMPMLPFIFPQDPHFRNIGFLNQVNCVY